MHLPVPMDSVAVHLLVAAQHAHGPMPVTCSCYRGSHGRIGLMNFFPSRLAYAQVRVVGPSVVQHRLHVVVPVGGQHDRVHRHFSISQSMEIIAQQRTF